MSQGSSEIYYTPNRMSSSLETENSSTDEMTKEKFLKNKLDKKNDGFDEETLHEIIVCLLGINHLTDARFVRFLFLTAPKKLVARKTLNYILAHVLTQSKQQKSYMKLKGCLHYLIGLLKYKIIDQRDIRSQYFLYYNLLEYPDLEVLAAELIYLTTTYDNIKPWFVRKVQRLYQMKGKRMHLLALIQLFKRIKLNLVTLTDLPEVKDETKAFTNMNLTLKKTLDAVATRNDVKVEHKIAFPDSNVNQIALRSTAYEKCVRSYRQFSNIREFLESYLLGSYDMYETCYDSLIGNPFNFVLLGVLSMEEKQQAKLYVQHIWSRIAEKELSEDDIKTFLNNLYNIHMIFGHNVFEIQENLYNFLRSYDFFQYRQEILQLAKLINYPNYEAFLEELLTVLYEKFIVAARFQDIDVMSSIINCLSDLLYKSYKMKSDTFEPSLIFNDPCDGERMSDMDLSLAITAVQHLCKILINVGHGDFLAMFSVMQFYEKLNAAENLYRLNTTNVLPPEISYAFMINPNIILLEHYAKLISTTSSLGQKYDLGSDHPGLIEIAKQANELYIFLFRDPMMTEFFQQNQIVRKSYLYRKVILSKVQRIYVLKHSLAFLHLTRIDSAGNLYDFDRIAVHLKRFSDACPHLMGLLSTVKATQIQNNDK